MTSAPEPLHFTLDEGLNFLAPVVVEDLIRVGQAYDGGYIIPASILPQIDTLVSFGISGDWSFEAQMRTLIPGLRIDAYDHSVSRGHFVSEAWRILRRALAFKTGLRKVASAFRLVRDYDRFFQGDVRHFVQRVSDERSTPVDVSIAEIFARVAGAKAIFLKMDIEGGEYGVIDSLLTHQAAMPIMAVEFHHTDTEREAFIQAIKKMQEFYKIVHLHANNFNEVCAGNLPQVLEITFVRRDHCPAVAQRARLPIALDEPNTRHSPDYVLTFKL